MLTYLNPHNNTMRSPSVLYPHDMCVGVGENLLTKKLISLSKDTMAAVCSRGIQREMLLEGILICIYIYYS